MIAAGTALAFVLLRPVRAAQPDLQLAETATASDATPLPVNAEIERTAA
jgi:hypothetical protein